MPFRPDRLNYVIFLERPWHRRKRLVKAWPHRHPIPMERVLVVVHSDSEVSRCGHLCACAHARASECAGAWARACVSMRAWVRVCQAERRTRCALPFTKDVAPLSADTSSSQRKTFGKSLYRMKSNRKDTHGRGREGGRGTLSRRVEYRSLSKLSASACQSPAGSSGASEMSMQWRNFASRPDSAPSLCFPNADGSDG